MKAISLAFVTSLVVISGCQTNPASPAARACWSGLEKAKKELNIAKVNGFSGTVEYSKAATLITGASIQYEFGKYPNCINKVKRARRFIRNSQVKR